MLIEASVGVESCWAVNDIVLTRGEYSRIVDIDIFCDGNPFTLYGGWRYSFNSLLALRHMP